MNLIREVKLGDQNILETEMERFYLPCRKEML